MPFHLLTLKMCDEEKELFVSIFCLKFFHLDLQFDLLYLAIRITR